MKVRLPSLLLIAFASFTALSPLKIENKTTAPCTITVTAPHLDESGALDKMILDNKEIAAGALFSGYPGSPLNVVRIMRSIPAENWDGFLRVTVIRIIETLPVTQTMLLLYTPGINQFYNRNKRSSLRPRLQVSHYKPMYGPDGQITEAVCEFATSTFDYIDGADRLTINTPLPYAIYEPLTDKLVIHDTPDIPFALSVEQTEERSPLIPPAGRPTAWPWRVNPPLAPVAVAAPVPGAAEPSPLSVHGIHPPGHGSPTTGELRHSRGTPGRPGSRGSLHGGFQAGPGRGRGRSHSGSAPSFPMLALLALASEEAEADDPLFGLDLHHEEAGTKAAS